MADDPTDLVKIRHSDTQEEREVPQGALPFFVNQGYEVLTEKGNVSKKKES